jgi:hypothetical protein
MEKLCKQLINTYNTNVLDNKGKIIGEELMKISTNYKDTGKGRSVLMNLIYNHFAVQKPQPEYIGSPMDLTVHWSETHEKIIYIFGEHHSDKIDCYRLGLRNRDIDALGAKIISIQYFLKELSRTTDCFIDFLFEVPATEIKSKGYHVDFDPYAGKKNFALSKLFDTFKDCINYITRSDKSCRLSRVHYFDSRYNDKDGSIKGSNIVNAFRVEIQNIRKITDTKDKYSFANLAKKLLKDNSDFVNMLEYIGDDDDNIILQFLIFQTTQNTYTHKELGLFEHNNSVRLAIQTFIEEENKKFMDENKLLWREHTKIILKFISEDEDRPTSEEFENSFNIINHSLVGVNSLVADVYLLSRLFKNFDLTQIQEKGYVGATDQPAKATNIIIYTGSKHADTYRLFLKNKLDFKQIAETGLKKKDPRSPMHCIDMSTIPQPFFNSWPPIGYIDNKPPDNKPPALQGLMGHLLRKK